MQINYPVLLEYGSFPFLLEFLLSCRDINQLPNEGFHRLVAVTRFVDDLLESFNAFVHPPILVVIQAVEPNEEHQLFDIFALKIPVFYDNCLEGAKKNWILFLGDLGCDDFSDNFAAVPGKMFLEDLDCLWEGDVEVFEGFAKEGETDFSVLWFLGAIGSKVAVYMLDFYHGEIII